MSVRVIMDRVLIVGAGITGSMTASLLRQQLPSETTISIWDKAKGAGGRMSTSHSPKDDTCTVDLGAQYITSTTQNFELHKSLYEELQSGGIFKEFKEVLENDRFSEPGSRYFITPRGVSSLVKYFLQKSGPNVKLDQQVSELLIEDDKWRVTTSCGKSEHFDIVVLTMPVPQILQLKGSLSSMLEKQQEIKEKLENVQYSSRFALGLYYDKGTKLDVPWTAKYIEGDPCIRFISLDSKKRNLGDDVGASIAVHAHVPFSLAHLEEDKDEVCNKYLLPQLSQLLPQLPQPSTIKCHKWRYSQVHRSMEGQPGAVVIHKNPLLICAGDAFTHSNFDGCVKSATKVSQILRQHSSL